MILKKPYVFLIKHFKFINFLIGTLLVILTMLTRSLYMFFYDYVRDGWYSSFGDLIGKYINLNFFLVVIGIIVLTLVILLLLHFKKKPRLFYLIIILETILTVVIFLIAKSTLATMQSTVIEPRQARLVRDLLFLINFPQYVLLVISFIRAFGFDIKKFNFGEDISDLNITLEDNEEFELEVGIDKDKLIRNIKKKIRTTKYIILENNALVILFGIIFLIIGFFWLFNFESKEKTIYKENETFMINLLQTTILDSYVTSTTPLGEKIEEGYNFVVVSLKVNNIFDYGIDFNLEDVSLKNNERIYSEVQNKYKSFVDIGYKLQDNTISGGEERTFVLVYKIEDTQGLSNLNLKFIQNDLKKYDVLLSPENIGNVKEKIEVDLGEEVNLKDNSQLLIENYKIVNDYNYYYEEDGILLVDIISSDALSVNKKILKIDGNIIGEDLNIKELDNFISFYGYIIYSNSDQTYKLINLKNQTPTGFSEDSAFFEVPEELKDASSIELHLVVRDIEYIYSLK